MNKIRFVEITNFKVFEGPIRIDLSHPAVLIGPNNAGKTSVIQALALWSRGIKAWYEKKGYPRKNSLEKLSAGINRLDILEVPVQETRFFWNKTRVRIGNTPIQIEINVGIEINGILHDCIMLFKQRDSEIIYCQPSSATMDNDIILSAATKINFNLLYPMSGIETEEPLVQEGRINVLMGQGQTAQVLRNLCYAVYEADNNNKSKDWASITDFMEKLFSIKLGKPALDPNRGSIILKYKQTGIEHDLDISLAGRGLQQILLLISYLHSHKNSILMIDEPDAHLEILRQKQIYEILKDVAVANKCQVIIATHSEVILDDAIDTNLTLLLNGEGVNLANSQDIKNALKIFSIDHYYKAKVQPSILYMEGSTDLEMLRTLAIKLNHQSNEILTGTLNYYYTRNIEAQNTLENRLDRAAGSYGDFKKHFYALKRYVPHFRGVAIFDSDAQIINDEINDDLAILFWKKYELENYFITPEVILKYIKKVFGEEDSLFSTPYFDIMNKVINNYLLTTLFNSDNNQLVEFLNASIPLKKTILKGIKMSEFTNNIFITFSKETNQSILLNKGEYYKLIELVNVDDIEHEIIEKLNYISRYLKI